MTLTSDEREEIATVLNHYLLNEYRRVTNYYKAIDNRVEVETGIYMYPCPIQKIYLDDENYAVTYDRQTVWTAYLDEDGSIVYDTTDNNPTPPQAEYDTVIKQVFYDFRDESEIQPIPAGYTGDTSFIPTYVAEYEWKRSDSGGGGVVG